jgi:hypothetical protein
MRDRTGCVGVRKRASVQMSERRKKKEKCLTPRSHENVIGQSGRPGHGGMAPLPGYDGNQQHRHIHDLMDANNG